MRAVVLVGGLGTRLRPLTDRLPKQLLPVYDRPLLDWVIGHLAAHGVHEVVLSMGYQPDAFRSAYPDGRCADVPLVYVIEAEPLDTAGAVAFAAAEAGIDDTFIVVNGDVLNDHDLTALVAFHHERGAEGTVAVAPVDDPTDLGVVVIGENGQVEAFVEKGRGPAPSKLVNAGTYVLDPAVLDRIDPSVRSNINYATFPAMVADGSLFALELDGWWVDVGTVARYLEANAVMVERRGCSYVAPDADVADDAVIERSVVASGSSVGAGAVVRDAVVLGGATVPSGMTLRDAVILDDGVVVTP